MPVYVTAIRFRGCKSGESFVSFIVLSLPIRVNQEFDAHAARRDVLTSSLSQPIGHGTRLKNVLNNEVFSYPPSFTV